MIQTAIIIGFLFTTSVQVSDLGLGAEIPAHPGLTTLGYLFTVVALIGLINAFNLIDGLDGLASGLAVIALAGIGLAATIAGYPEYALSIIVMITPIMVFWLANLGMLGARLKTFLGDAGATLLGFLVGVALIQSSQAPVAIIEPVFVVWCVAVPVIDTLQVMYHRLRDGRTIFDSDRLHLHYRLVDAGYSKHRWSRSCWPVTPWSSGSGWGLPPSHRRYPYSSSSRWAPCTPTGTRSASGPRGSPPASTHADGLIPCR